LRLFRVRADLRMRCFALNKHGSAEVITSQSLFFLICSKMRVVIQFSLFNIALLFCD
jgi:hypothetical protein